MILARYIARKYLRSFLMIAAVFLLILLLIDMIEMIRRFSDEGIAVVGALKLAALNITGSFYSILSLIAVLGGIALFLNLSRSSEMVALRASGRSGLRVAVAPAVTAALIGALAVGLLNPLVAVTGRFYDNAVAEIEQIAQQTVSLSQDAIWLRQAVLEDGDEAGQVVIRAGRTSPDATRLYHASFIIFGDAGGPRRRLLADEAVLRDGAWHLTDVNEYDLTAINPEATVRHHDKFKLLSDLTAQRIRDGFGRPDAIPIWQLPHYIAALERAGFTAARHRVWFQMELASPLLLATMVLIAAAFTMQHARGRSNGIAVLLAFAAGIGLFFLRNVAQVMGENGQVSPFLAAWAPPLIGLLLALGLILQREDG